MYQIDKKVPVRAKTILLVEDEASITQEQSKILIRNGFTVRMTSSGRKAIEEFRTDPNIDMILMDVNLGQGRDGTETARAILAEKDIPIVFLYSHSEEEYVRRTEATYSYGYVAKSAGEAVLIASIKTALRLVDAERDEREALINEKDVLFQELQHRVKNSLNMINAILYLKESEAKSDAIREVLRSVHGRIEVLSLLYRLADANYSSGVRLDEYLRAVCESMSYAHDAVARGILIAAHFEPISIDLKRGANLGLVLNELLGNAFNYAFPPERLEQRGGTVELSLRKTGDELTLTVSDDGVGLPEGYLIEESDGFGFRLAIELMEQTAGSLEHLTDGKGAAFRVRLKL
ncbi:MAG: response regulator [Treponemataceae bacterium]